METELICETLEETLIQLFSLADLVLYYTTICLRKQKTTRHVDFISSKYYERLLCGIFVAFF